MYMIRGHHLLYISLSRMQIFTGCMHAHVHDGSTTNNKRENSKQRHMSDNNKQTYDDNWLRNNGANTHRQINRQRDRQTDKHTHNLACCKTTNKNTKQSTDPNGVRTCWNSSTKRCNHEMLQRCLFWLPTRVQPMVMNSEWIVFHWLQTLRKKHYNLGMPMPRQVDSSLNKLIYNTSARYANAYVWAGRCDVAKNTSAVDWRTIANINRCVRVNCSHATCQGHTIVIAQCLLW